MNTENLTYYIEHVLAGTYPHVKSHSKAVVRYGDDDDGDDNDNDAGDGDDDVGGAIEWNRVVENHAIAGIGWVTTSAGEADKYPILHVDEYNLDHVLSSANKAVLVYFHTPCM